MCSSCPHYLAITPSKNKLTDKSFWTDKNSVNIKINIVTICDYDGLILEQYIRKLLIRLPTIHQITHKPML